MGREKSAHEFTWSSLSDLLVTCEHVVHSASQVVIVSGGPIFDGKRGARAEVVTLDERRDLALLRRAIPDARSLEVSQSEKLDDATPLCNPWQRGLLTREEGLKEARGRWRRWRGHPSAQG